MAEPIPTHADGRHDHGPGSLLVAEPLLVRVLGAHACDRYGPAGRPCGRLVGLGLELGAGLHVVVGAPEDGSYALADLLAGKLRPLRGTVRIAGADPSKAPRLRARMGVLGPRPSLPELGQVAALVRIAAANGASEAQGAIERLGLGPLWNRSLRSLAPAEARALELALALGVPEPVALVLHEPFTEVAVAEPATVRTALRERAAAGSCVVLLTSSMSDAELSGVSAHVIRHGRLLGSAKVAEGWPLGARELVVWLDPKAGPDARALARALGERPEITGIGWQAAAASGAPELVAVRGPELEQVALVMGDVCAELGVAVLSLHTSSPSLEELLREASVRAAQAAAQVVVASEAAAGPPREPTTPAPVAEPGAEPMIRPAAPEPAPATAEPAASAGPAKEQPQ